MPYYINGKEVKSTEYIDYLESVLLSVEEDLDEMLSHGLPCAHPKVDEAANIIKINKDLR